MSELWTSRQKRKGDEGARGGTSVKGTGHESTGHDLETMKSLV